ncbi:hypothetical protein C0431_12630 [bacterium]|nr:hypothetical protein [bacterium]
MNSKGAVYMTEKILPTEEQIMAFDENYSVSVEIYGTAALALNANGQTELGASDDFEPSSRAHCYVFIEDEKVSFSSVKDTDEFMIELVNALHDVDPSDAIEKLRSDDFPYRLANDNDIHWPC